MIFSILFDVRWTDKPHFDLRLFEYTREVNLFSVFDLRIGRLKLGVWVEW